VLYNESGPHIFSQMMSVKAPQS